MSGWNSSLRALCHSYGTNKAHDCINTLFVKGVNLLQSLDCLGDLYYDRGASLCVKSKRLSKQMQIFQIVYQTRDTACHAGGSC